MTNKSSSCSSHCRPTLPELKLYQAFIFSIPILFTLVLLLLFYMLYLRRRRRTAWITSQARIHYQDRGFISVPSDSERGVKKEFRDTLPIMIFNQSFLEEDTQCAVCLGEYEADDMLKQLPVCGHAFHLECIDHWLQNNITCPLCRTSLPQANKVVPLDSSANVTVTQQTRDFILASALQQVQSIQDVPVQEVPDMQNARREEEIRPINGILSDETSSTHLDIDRDEIYVAVLQGGHSIANVDTAMHIESTGM